MIRRGLVRVPPGAAAATDTGEARPVRISQATLDKIVAALTPGALFAGEVRAIGEDDAAILSPPFRLATFRRQREALAALFDEIDRD